MKLMYALAMLLLMGVGTADAFGAPVTDLFPPVDYPAPEAPEPSSGTED
ncbi:hypothetical protein [Sulfitobacter sp. S190]|nr:hypothetical protein [Sulfitobacter sp. S190]UWR21599.1 hypothetical protein K3756_12980 [Sulfitobacter sp. S190]